jgi:hypothetical protein
VEIEFVSAQVTGIAIGLVSNNGCQLDKFVEVKSV